MRTSFFTLLAFSLVGFFPLLSVDSSVDGAAPSNEEQKVEQKEEQQRPSSGAELFAHEWIVTKPDSSQDEVARELATAQQSSVRSRRSGRAFESPAKFVVKRGVGDGLGPLHNAKSCADCHEGGGGAGVNHNVTLITVEPRSEPVIRVSDHDRRILDASSLEEYARQIMDVFPGLINEKGKLSFETVVHNLSTSDDYAAIRDKLVDFVPGGIPDEWFVPEKRTSAAIAARPVVAGRNKDFDFYLSQRNSPPLYGLGVIDRIPPKQLMKLVEKQAKDGRVSGRMAGKFGWRGQISSLTSFVGQACAAELGLTHTQALQAGDPTRFKYIPPGGDMKMSEVVKLTSFVQRIPLPRELPQEQHTSREVFAGEGVFNSIGCADCHVPDVPPAINVFSDLLLHDMGARLQAASPAPRSAKTKMVAMNSYDVCGPFSGPESGYNGGLELESFPIPEDMEYPDDPQFPRGPLPEGDESESESEFEDEYTWDDLQREWRTPPLWGIADTGPYLHDGRAESLEEAILWHGGESQASRDRYDALTAQEKEMLLAFLSSLRAPE